MQASSPFLISYIVFLTLIPSLRPFKMFPDWQCLCSDARQTISGFLFLLSFPSPPPHLTKTKDLKEMGGGRRRREREIFILTVKKNYRVIIPNLEKKILYIYDVTGIFIFPVSKLTKPVTIVACLYVQWVVSKW